MVKSIFPRYPQSFISPFLKWVGGKRQLAPILKDLMPPLSQIREYVEPFVGGGGMFFSLQPERAIINDLNEELINVYKVIRDNPRELIECLKTHTNSPEHYYEVRDLDRQPLFQHLSQVERAARIIYLNKTCFNGLFRVNAQGFFNVPYGYYKNPQFQEVSKILSVSGYLRSADIRIMSGNYTHVLSHIKVGTFVYLDPPYAPISDTSNFTGYNSGGFSNKEQESLRDFCLKISELGAFVMLSNSCSPIIYELYNGQFNIHEVKVNRAISAAAASRGQVTELVITNYN